ncbi:esterase [Actinocatenispora thailandica]|uniref:Esterase n=1 Tax=Actinocatenispora thailandica TaxID=227318 RepID=A0A7R7DU74_9ACTN|nr:alpha/beta hydrolase [Actinocatenispora thailandica]BCJ37775.1 esterase [Actinocatenispora thailandica]
MTTNWTVQARHVDPELAAMQVLSPRITLDDLTAARELEQTLATQTTRQPDDVEVLELVGERRDGTALAMRLYRPARWRGATLPVLLFIHGGSFVTGGLHSEDNRCIHYAREAQVAVVAVDYRLAPEHPFPAAVEDCQDALGWIVEHARTLGCDPARIALGGLSAGGCLGAALALWTAEHRDIRPVFLMLLFPVLDARLATPSVNEFTDTPVLIADTVHRLWNLYLGEPGQRAAPLPPLASPAEATDVHGFPPTLMVTAQYDPLRDEGLAFAARLAGAGVPVDLHHFGRGFHSFDSFDATRLGLECLDIQVRALQRALAP